MRFYVPRFWAQPAELSNVVFAVAPSTSGAASEANVLFRLYFPGTQFASRRKGAGRLCTDGDCRVRRVAWRFSACLGGFHFETSLCRGVKSKEAARCGGNTEVWRTR